MDGVFKLQETKLLLLAMGLMVMGAFGTIYTRQQISKGLKWSGHLEEQLDGMRRKMAHVVVEIAHLESPSYVFEQVQGKMAIPSDRQVIDIIDERSDGTGGYLQHYAFKGTHHALAGRR